MLESPQSLYPNPPQDPRPLNPKLAVLPAIRSTCKHAPHPPQDPRPQLHDPKLQTHCVDPKYHLRRGVGLIKFLENGSRPQPPTSLLDYTPFNLDPET